MFNSPNSRASRRRAVRGGAIGSLVDASLIGGRIQSEIATLTNNGFTIYTKNNLGVQTPRMAMGAGDTNANTVLTFQNMASTNFNASFVQGITTITGNAFGNAELGTSSLPWYNGYITTLKGGDADNSLSFVLQAPNTSGGFVTALTIPAANAPQTATWAPDMKFERTLTLYNNIATVTNGVPSILAQVNLTAQSAAIAATTIYAVPAAGVGMYRVSWVATVTRAATTSSTLGGSGGFQVTYTDNDDSVVKTSPLAGAPSAGANQAYSQTNQGNTTATQISGCVVVNAKASTNIQYAIGYTSSGATTMQYNLHIRVEAL